MSGFSAEWLELREPFDAAARAAPLVAELRAHLARGTQDAPLAVLDLGAGAGSNLRYLAPLLGGVQHWRLADHDPRLLEAAIATTHAWADARGADVRRSGASLAIRAPDFVCDVACEPVDLADLSAVELPTGGLVTAAALLDLVSHDWLDALARRCRAARAAVCFALSYDGRTTASPRSPRMRRSSSSSTGISSPTRASGPRSGRRAARRRASGIRSARLLARVLRTQRLGHRLSRAPAMQLALLDGWLGAALRDRAGAPRRLTAWHERRRAHVAAGRSELRVGHVDLVGWL